MRLEYEIIHPPGDRQTNAPPVVMLHGMLDSRKTWKYIAPKIAKNTGRMVYIVDERNHGDSPRSKEMDWSILGDDVGGFLMDHNIPKAVLVGHSMGGISSFTCALRKPAMVDKLIVEDIATRVFRPKDGNLIIQIMNLLRDSLTAIPDDADEETAKIAVVGYIKALIPEGFLGFSGFDMDMIALKKRGDTFQWQANFDVLEEFLSTDRISHDVSKEGIYNGDTMFLYGTKSFFKVNRDPQINKLFPKAVKVPFEGATHLVHHEHPQKFVQVVSTFINNGPVPLSKI